MWWMEDVLKALRKQLREHKKNGNLLARNGTVSVARQYGKDGEDGEEFEDSLLEVHKFVTDPASVRVSYGLTINLGNFQSARVEVSVSVPCYKEEIDDAYRWAIAFAEGKVRGEANTIKGVRDGREEG